MNRNVRARGYGVVLVGMAIGINATNAWAQGGLFGWDAAATPATKSRIKAEEAAKPSKPAAVPKAAQPKPKQTNPTTMVPAPPAAPPLSAAPVTPAADTLNPSTARTADSNAPPAPPASDPADTARQSAQEWKQRRETLLNNQPLAP